MMVYVYCGVHTLLRAASFHLLVTAGVLVMLENMTCGFVQGTGEQSLSADQRGQKASLKINVHGH